MQIERHEMPDGREAIFKQVFDGTSLAGRAMREQLADAHQRATTQETLREIKQAEFDPEDPCPCGSPRKAKNCCAGRLLRRLRAEREKAGAEQ
jgi:uncharacterized protein YecA (UPF0149 family)